MSTNNSNTQAILLAGFDPPPQDTFLKDDPRGVEYGQFTASLIPGGKIQVTWISGDSKHTYSMTFHSDGNFAAWAAECT